MLEALLKNTVFASRQRLIEIKKHQYENTSDPEQIRSFQLRRFNLVWKHAYKNIAFYEWWMKEHHLPEIISTLEEISDFPVLTKKVINKNRELIFDQFKRSRTVSTGGSTGEPTLFPVCTEDFSSIYTNTYVARGWWGLKPLDRIVSLWGHSHLFGSGLKGKAKEYKRRLQDSMINTVRLNAYDMRPDIISEYYRVVLRAQPVAIIGYTSCLYKLARYMVDNGLQGSVGSSLKVVIPTSESVSDNDVKTMEDAFKVPVAIEYGMAETGVIAYSRNHTNDMPVFWDSFVCRVDAGKALFVTTITDRLFPLINYCTDDCVTSSVVAGESVLAFQKVEGRKQESFTVGTQAGFPLVISGILLVHIMKGYPNIYSVQGEQLTDKSVCIYLTSNKLLDLNKAHSFMVEQLFQDHPEVDPAALILRQTDDVQRSVAGKEKVIRST